MIGGATTTEGAKDPFFTFFGPSRVLGTNEVYDPATNKWESRRPMSVPRNHAFGGVVNGKIYVIGGRTGHGFILSATNTDVVEEYNPVNDTWSVPKERMPTARSGGASGSDGRRIYVAGGEVTTKDLVGAFKSVEAYDPVTNSWLTLPSMPMPRHGIAGAVIGNRFHLVSGMMQSAGALTFLDPTLSTHTAMHDILELQFGAPPPTAAARAQGWRRSKGEKRSGNRGHHLPRRVVMSRLLILGATGSLGRHVLRQAVAAGHEVTVFVRTPSKLSPEVRERVSVHTGDLSALVPLDLIRGQDALINCAGHVADGEAFVGLIDRLVTSRGLASSGGAARLLVSGGRGAPRHRLVRPPRRRAAQGEVHVLAAPGQLRAIEPLATGLAASLSRAMVDQPPLGLDRLRVSIDVLPVRVPAFARALPGPLLLPVFASLIPQMIVPYADAAALMLANLDRGNAMSRHRVGLACPRACGDGNRSSRPEPLPRHRTSCEQRYEPTIASRARSEMRGAMLAA